MPIRDHKMTKFFCMKCEKLDENPKSSILDYDTFVQLHVTAKRKQIIMKYQA